MVEQSDETAALKIRYIDPVTSTEELQALGRHVAIAKQRGTTVELVTLAGPHLPFDHVEYHSYAMLTAPHIVGLTRDAALKGFHAVIIGCAYDPALQESREVSGSAVVTAPLAASVAAAEPLANRIGVLVGRDKWIPSMVRRLRDYVPAHRVACIQPINASVRQIHENRGTIEPYVSAAAAAVNDHGAEAIIAACTMAYGMHRELQQTLGVPVIDPIIAAVAQAEHAAALALRHGMYPSRAGSQEPPPEAEIAEHQIFPTDASELIGSALLVE